MGISGPRGRTHYRSIERPHIFDGLLTKAWRDGDDFIVAVPHRSGSLARVVEAGDLVRDPPQTGEDLGQITGYVKALENPRLPLAEAEWRNAHTLVSPADAAAARVAFGSQPSPYMSSTLQFPEHRGSNADLSQAVAPDLNRFPLSRSGPPWCYVTWYDNTWPGERSGARWPCWLAEWRRRSDDGGRRDACPWAS